MTAEPEASEPTEKPTSVVFDHCLRVYNEMVDQARDENDVGLVYEGHLTKLFAQLGMATPYYTAVMNHLKSMACVEQLRRGGGNSPSRWLLLREPNEEAYKSIESMNRAKSGKVGALEQQVRDLTKRVATLETNQHNNTLNYASLNNAYVALSAKFEGMYNHLMANEVLTP